MEKILKKLLSYVVLIMRALADTILWLAKGVENFSKDSVLVCAGHAYLVERIVGTTQVTTVIEREDFTRIAALEPMFPVDFTQFEIDIEVDEKITRFQISRKDDDVSLVAMARSFSETILTDNAQMIALIKPKLTEMVKHVHEKDWNKEDLEGCQVSSFQYCN